MWLDIRDGHVMHGHGNGLGDRHVDGLSIGIG